MKRLLTLFFVYTVAFVITSCVTIYPNQKFLIGTWTPEKGERYDVPNPQSPAADNQGQTKSGTGETSPLAGKQVNSFGEKAPMLNSIKSDLRSTLTFNPDKTAIKEYNGKADHGTWKLKKKGTRLLAKFKETGQKMTFDILNINDTSAVVAESFPFGSLKLTWKKEKK